MCLEYLYKNKKAGETFQILNFFYVSVFEGWINMQVQFQVYGSQKFQVLFSVSAMNGSISAMNRSILQIGW